MVAGPRERDPQKLRRQVERGRHAEELVNDPMMQEAFDNIEKEIELRWKSSAAGDLDVREEAYRLRRLLMRLRGHFKQILISGSNAKALLEQEQQSADRAASRGSPRPGYAGH